MLQGNLERRPRSDGSSVPWSGSRAQKLEFPSLFVSQVEGLLPTLSAFLLPI